MKPSMPTSGVHATARAESHSVGPNSIVQTAEALRALAGPVACTEIFERAGLSKYLACPPSRMVPQEEAALLFQAVRAELSEAKATAVLAEAGRRTGRYIIANRIPPAVARLLRVLPRSVGARVLLTTIHKHAWTFAGSGGMTVRLGRALQLEIENNPLATPCCPWHVATLAELFGTLVAPGVRVDHVACSDRGRSICRFQIEFSRKSIASSSVRQGTRATRRPAG